MNDSVGNNSGATQHDPDMFDVRSALRTIVEATRDHWGTVLLTCALTLAAVSLYFLVWPPLFIVKSEILLEKDNDLARDTFYVEWNIFRKQDARTELRMMTSGPVLLKVIERENLTYDDVFHPTLSQLSYFWDKSWIGSNYKAIKRKIFPDPDMLGREEEMTGKILKDLRAGIKIQQDGDSHVANLKMKGPSRRVAQVANTLVDVYLEYRAEAYRYEAQRAFDTLDVTARQAEKDLAETEVRRLEFAVANELQLDLQVEEQAIEQLVVLQRRMAEGDEKIAVMETSLADVNRQLESESPTMVISSITELNAIREATKMRRLDSQAALVRVSDLYREDSPELQEIRNDLAQLDELLEQEPEKLERGSTEGLNSVWQRLVVNRSSLQADLAGALAGRAVMQRTAADLREQLAGRPALTVAMHSLGREYLLAQEKFQALALKRAQAAVSLTTTNAAMPSMRVVGYALPPASKVWPRIRYLYPGGLLVGLVLGIIAALVVRFFSGRIHRAQVEHGRGPVPLYGSVAVAAGHPPLTVVRGGAAASGGTRGERT